MKWISVIVPCYNVEKYMDRCVSSLVNQTLGIENMELIFVDDASKDSTYRKLLQWEHIYPESIMVIHCGENRKQGVARNVGLKYASGKYIGFVDSDDWVEPEMYEQMYEIAKRTSADMVGVLYQREGEDGEIYFRKNHYDGKFNTLCNTEKDGYCGLPGGVWSGLFSKNMIVDNHVYFPEGLAYEDNYWGALVGYYIKSYYVIPKILYHYVVNTASTIMQTEAAHHMDRLEIEIMKLRELKKRGFYEENKEKIDFQFLRLYYINTLHIIFTRMEQLPMETIFMMQREVQKRVPDFMNHPYIAQLNWIEQFFLKTAGMNLSKADWEEIRNSYLSDISSAQQWENKMVED